MNAISIWASRHLWPARILLTGIHICTLLLAWSLSGLQEQPFGFSLLLCALPFIVAVSAYAAGSKSFRKRFHLFAATGSFWLAVCFFQAGGTLQHAFVTGIAVQEVQASKTEDSPVIKKKKKPSFFKRITSDKTKRTLLSILTILVALGLLFLIAALSCSIACSGADALALAVGVIGLIAVIFGTVAVLKRIKLGPKRNRVPENDPEETTQ